MKLRGEAGPLRIDHTRSNEMRSEGCSPDSWRHSTPSGSGGQLGIATKSHEKPQNGVPCQIRFSCAFVPFRGYGFHSRESPRREGVFPWLRPSLNK